MYLLKFDTRMAIEDRIAYGSKFIVVHNDDFISRQSNERSHERGLHDIAFSL